MTGQLVGMLLAGVGALVLVRLARRGLPWAKPAAAGLAVVTLVLAGAVLFPGPTSPRQDRALLENYNTVAGRVLGAYLAERFEGGALLMVPRGFGEGHFVERALIDGLQAGFGERIRVAATVEPVIPDGYLQQLEARIAAGEIHPLEKETLLTESGDWYTTAVLFDAVRRQPDPVDLLVLLAPVPLDFVRAIPRHAGRRPAIALLYPPLANPAEIIGAGRVEALVAMKPPREWTAPKASDAASVFDERYRLMTADGQAVDVHSLLNRRP